MTSKPKAGIAPFIYNPQQLCSMKAAGLSAGLVSKEQKKDVAHDCD